MALPRTWRPLGPRIAGVVGAVGLAVVLAMLWFGFDAETRSRVNVWQQGTVVAMYLGGCAVLYSIARSRVEAHGDRLVVVNGYRRHEYDWAQVVAVRMPSGAPWVTLDLADGTTRPAMGIQGSDGTRARQAVRDLRSILDSTSS